MLQAIRDKVTGWIAYGIIFLISIPFALWGVNSYLGGGEALPAATINGEEITLRDLDQAYANYRQRLAQLFGGTIPDTFGSEDILRAQVLDQLVEEFTLRQYTVDQWYRLGDKELNQMIRSMDVFQRDGQFDTEIYQAQLRSQGYSPLGFEQELRRNASMEQFQGGIRATAFVTPVLEKQFNGLRNQSRKIRYLSYQVDATATEIDESEVEQHYLSQTDRYRTPEKVRIDYIELDLDSVKQSIEVNEDDVRARYLENKDAYTSAESREASHILIKVAEDDASDEALTRITQLRDRIIAGESFADLARDFSEDPGSAGDGGSLGEIERGVMVQTFEAALFAMQVEQLSEPVKTAFGWHLIKLHSVSGGETRSFESVKADLEDELKTEMAESQVYDLVENLANLAYEQSDSLLPAAEQLGLTLQTSDWFDRATGTGIASNARVRQMAFSAEVLSQGLNSEAIELGNESVVFIHLNQHQPATVQPLEQVVDAVRSDLVRIRVLEQSLKTGVAALEDLRAGKSLDTLADEWASSIRDAGFVGRNESEVNASILNRTFSMPKPDAGLVYDGVSLSGGEYVIIELSAVLSNNADPDDGNTVDTLVEERAGSEYQAALKLITSRADVVKTPIEDLQ